MSVSANRAMHFAAVIMMLFVMVIINMLASTRCDEMMKAIGQKQSQLAKLEKDCERACGRWDQLRTDDNLERILPRLGMSMGYAKPAQVVRMGADGRPMPRQISVMMADRRRGSSGNVAGSTSGKTTTRRRR